MYGLKKYHTFNTHISSFGHPILFYKICPTDSVIIISEDILVHIIEGLFICDTLFKWYNSLVWL